jgi:hypothetical protein
LYGGFPSDKKKEETKSAGWHKYSHYPAKAPSKAWKTSAALDSFLLKDPVRLQRLDW